MSALLGLGTMACGGSSNNASSSQISSGATANTVEKKSSTTIDERDSNGLYDGDDAPVLDYGRVSDAKTQQAIGALVRHYYSAAAAADGATACSLLYSLLAEAVPEDYGRDASLRGKTCAEVMSKLFKRNHRELALDNSTLRIILVKVEDDKALTVMHFATARGARKISERRQGSSWKILELFDSALP